MIKVTIGTNTNRKSITLNPDTTIREALETNNIDYSTGGIHLDGLAVAGADLDKSFADFGVEESCYLVSVVKADGGLN